MGHVLINQSENSTLLDDLTIATSFRSRAQGLIGTRSLNENAGIWFPKTNWIHTFFMSIPIDVIYLDKSMRVKKLQPNLQPWRFPAPVFKAHSVVEASAGFIRQKNLKIGDQLHVGH